jgi:hypothetical protein
MTGFDPSRSDNRRNLGPPTPPQPFVAEFAAPYIERKWLTSVTLLPASTPEELAAFFDPRKAGRVEIRNA